MDKTFYMEDKTNKFISVHFDSILDLMDYNPPWPENKWVFTDYFKGGKDTKGGKWLGPTNKTSQDVISGAMLGDHELYKKRLVPMISKLREAMGMHKNDYKQVIKTSRRKPVFQDHGDELDIHKVYQGQIDTAWRSTKRIEVAKETKLVTLFVQIAGTSGYNAIDSLWRAAVAVLLMEELQKAGKSVKIVVGGASHGVTRGKHSMCVSITVKNYNEKLSFERLAAMSHLGFYRTFGFGAKGCQPYKLSGGLGYSVDITPRMIPLQFAQDVHKGHTKMVLLDRSLSLTDAVQSMKRAFKKMKEFSDEG